MAEFKPGARPGRHKPYDAAADIESKQIALGIQQADLRTEARMYQPNTGDDIGSKRLLRNRFRHRDNHVAGQRRYSAPRDSLPLPWPEELRGVFDIAFNAEETVAEEHR